MIIESPLCIMHILKSCNKTSEFTIQTSDFQNIICSICYDCILDILDVINAHNYVVICDVCNNIILDVIEDCSVCF